MKQTLKVKEKGSLGNLKKGQIAKVINMQSDNPSLRRRLLDMGLIPNTSIELLYKSPFGDPCAYLIRGTVIAIRNRDAKEIEVYYE